MMLYVCVWICEMLDDFNGISLSSGVCWGNEHIYPWDRTIGWSSETKIYFLYICVDLPAPE